MTSEADDLRAQARPKNTRKDASTTSSPNAADRFWELLANADELLRLSRWAATASATCAPSAWDGFTVFLDAALPHDQAIEIRLARAIRVADDTISKLRTRALSPASVPAEPLSRLGRAMRLDWSDFDTLVCRDLDWFANASPMSVLRGRGRDTASVTQELHAAWERAAEDEPTGL